MTILIILLLILNFILVYKHDLISKKFNVFDAPDSVRKIHKENVAITGGLVIFLNYLLIIILNHILELNLFDAINVSPIKWFVVYIFAPVCLYLLGLYDDKFDLKPLQKLLVSTIIFYIVVNIDKSLQIKNIYFHFINKGFNLNNYTIFFTVLCFLLFQHAFNMFDGINLQICIYSLVFLIFVYLLSKIYLFLILCIPLLIFGYQNFKNKSFLGDGGCYFLSYLFSIHTIYFYNVNILDIEKIYLLMILPGIDMLRIFIQRLINGRSPFYSDRKHFHHYLLLKMSNINTNLIIATLIITPLILSFFYENLILLIILSKFIYFSIFYLIVKKK